MTKQVIVMRKDLNMRKGKIAAQACHASLGVFTKSMQISGSGNLFIGSIAFGEVTKDWLDNSFTKICVSCDSEEELLTLYANAEAANLPAVLVTDNGVTEFNGVKTHTCIAIGPAIAGDIYVITGHLKLL
jgi:PTH2 family peptidyl-tRNA hydrolase